MNTIYIIIEQNSYDGYDIVGDHFYTSEKHAIEVCKDLNRKSGSKKDYFHVVPLEQAP